MLRECACALAAIAMSGCSLILDFSGSTEPDVDAAFTQAECDFKEPNDTRDTAIALAVTDVGPAAICPKMSVDDHDFYRITLPTSSSVSFKITYFFSSNSDLDLQLTNMAGDVLSSSRGFDNDEIIVCPGASPPCTGPLAPGDYILEVLPGQPGMANRYDISIGVVP